MAPTTNSNGPDEGLFGIDNASNPLPALAACARGFLSETYDFIIIGGGTAGLAVAARLTEDPEVVVGVLEVGKSRLDDPLVDNPAAFVQMLGNPEYDHCFKTVPQVGTLTRSDADYDDWATLVGDSGWSSTALKHYMRKHETLEPIDESILDQTDYPHIGEHHGTNGPVHTSFNESSLPIDPWSGDHIGFYNTLGLVARSGPHKGKRSYAARGYFEANASRPNLKVLCEAQVNKIVLEDGIAKGVEFVWDGMHETVYAKKEVILCGGTINSPQILELSGIGDPAILEQAGVECKVELPGVGRNLQDHAVVAIGLELKPGNITSDILGDPATMEAAVKAYTEHQCGPLTSISCTQGFLPYENVVSSDELENTVKTIREIQNAPHTTPFYKQQLDLSSVIDPAYLKHPADVAVLAAGLDFVHKATKTKHLAPIIQSRFCPAASRDLDNAADREEAVKDWVMGEYHLIGTCAMGEVVDSRLRVKGVKGLRVVDASVFPNHVSGNICSSVYTVAEKAADLIKEDWDIALEVPEVAKLQL
ncbi:unnamed protein product [Aureobasidium mustum]|uniref:Glucose-methanol-choline oxidoreductase N-terminal domain-containing protein n=1 Tax=Aureobasidium mustum TaxID=2773714 RepID=A0A9N8PKR7_9PEZI|nr:unnamed protein product [Aureobasidium mustum]